MVFGSWIVVLLNFSSMRFSALSVSTGLAAPKGLDLLLVEAEVCCCSLAASTVRGFSWRRGRSAGASRPTFSFSLSPSFSLSVRLFALEHFTETAVILLHECTAAPGCITSSVNESTLTGSSVAETAPSLRELKGCLAAPRTDVCAIRLARRSVRAFSR